MHFKHRIFFTILGLMASLSGYATHIVGGNFEFDNLGNDNYRLTLKVFIDCKNGDPSAFWDSPIYIGMYEKNTNEFKDSFLVRLKSGPDDTLELSNKKCSQSIDFCMQIATYSRILKLNPADYTHADGYYLSWERCCRNSVILNIKEPGSTGIAFYLEIPPLTTVNSSPKFKNLPLSLLCVGLPYSYDFNVDDVDGDSLYFKMVNPLAGFTTDASPNSPKQTGYPFLHNGPYLPALWNVGYGLSNIMNGNPELKIDPYNGYLTVTPTKQGVFVLSVACEEYRNGVKIGEVRRELQYTVSVCSGNTPPAIDVGLDKKVYEVLAGENFALSLLIKDANGDSVFTRVEGDIFNSEVVGPRVATYSQQLQKSASRIDINWKTDCSQSGEDTFWINIIYRDNGCPLPVGGKLTLGFKIQPAPNPPKPVRFCAEVLNRQKIRVYWRHSYRQDFFAGVVVERKLDTTWQTIDTVADFSTKSYIDSGATDFDVTEYCYRISLINICGKKGPSSYEWCSKGMATSPLVPKPLNISVRRSKNITMLWQKNTQSDFLQYELYRKQPGEPWRKIASIDTNWFVDPEANPNIESYHYKVRAVNQCQLESGFSTTFSNIYLQGDTFLFENKLFWNPLLVWDPVRYDLDLKEIATSDSSLWPLNTDSFYTHDLMGQSAIWKYRIIGVSEVDSVKSFSNEITLFAKPVVWIPNAFTPNSDGLNDSFGMRLRFVHDIHFQIYSRWGGLVFESDDLNNFWSAPTPLSGVYLYKLYGKKADGSLFWRSGPIFLVD